jgi:hypothetical protein
MTDITDQDRRLVDLYIGSFVRHLAIISPNWATADNLRRAAEVMVAVAREDGRRAVAEAEPHG